MYSIVVTQFCCINSILPVLFLDLQGHKLKLTIVNKLLANILLQSLRPEIVQ